MIGAILLAIALAIPHCPIPDASVVNAAPVVLALRENPSGSRAEVAGLDAPLPGVASLPPAVRIRSFPMVARTLIRTETSAPRPDHRWLPDPPPRTSAL